MDLEGALTPFWGAGPGACVMLPAVNMTSYVWFLSWPESDDDW
jgi:hypothetical protein